MKGTWASLALGLVALACAPAEAAQDVAVPGQPGRMKSSAAERALRRAYDGAPPVVPHASFGVACVSCHTTRGLEVAGLGFAPPSPHAETAGLGAAARCVQCHVERATETLFVETGFTGLRQDLRRGKRQHAYSPPVLPHPAFMRENCLACHDGPAAREEIRTSHPERPRCTQCHVEQRSSGLFER